MEEDCNPMEVLFTRRCARYMYVVPEGLRELMSDISREVLRCHPKEIYCFIADYLDALFITRENARVAALLVEDVTEAGATLREILYKTSLSLEQAIRAVRIIQRAFRRHLDRKRRRSGEIEPIDPFLIICKMMLRLNITYDKASQAARIIQTAWRCYRQRMDVWRARFENAVDWREAARYTLRLYKKYAATWEYTRAATLIQAAYRGYYTRRYLRYLAKKKPCGEIDVLSYLIAQYEHVAEEEEPVTQAPTISLETLCIMFDPQDRAARIIQKTVRRFLAKVKGHEVVQEEYKEVMEHIENVNEALFEQEETEMGEESPEPSSPF